MDKELAKAIGSLARRQILLEDRVGNLGEGHGNLADWMEKVDHNLKLLEDAVGECEKTNREITGWWYRLRGEFPKTFEKHGRLPEKPPF